MRSLCARYGLPEVIVSDNGTQFTSGLFKTVCDKNGIKHILTPPCHSQSNGQAERSVDTLKRALLKLKGEGRLEETLDLFLGTYRMTPNERLKRIVNPVKHEITHNSVIFKTIFALFSALNFFLSCRIADP